MTHATEGTPERAPTEYSFGAFRLDVASLQLWRGAEVVALTPKAFDTLLVLIRNRHRLVRKDELMAAVWANSFVSEDSLTQNITALRRALGDDSHQPEYITTIPRRGYRFIAPVVEKPPADHVTHTAPVLDAPPLATSSHVEAEPVPVEVPASPRPPGTSSGARWLWAIPVVAAAFAITLFMLVDAPASQPQPGALLFTIDAPAGTRLASGGAISPDSRYLAFVAQDDGSGMTRLWVRSLDASQSTVLEGTEGAAKPFWSPDSQAIGFFANGRLRRVAREGGPVQTLASTVGLTVAGGTWGADDIILFSSFRSGVNAVPASGGEVTPVTELDPSSRDTAHRWPQFLPNGRQFLFSIYAETPERTGTYLGSMGSTQVTRLMGDVGGVYAPPGYLLYIRDLVLMAQPFNLASSRVAGTATAVADQVFPLAPTSGATISASPTNILTFGGRNAETRLTWYDRAGQVLSTIKAPPNLHNPTLSSDERYVLAGSGTDVWLIDLEREATTRIVPGNTPLLSPDAEQFVFTSGRIDGIADIYVRSMIGRSEDRLLLRTGENKIVNDWSRDGRFLLYSSTNPQTRMDLWIAPTTGDEPPTPLLASSSNEFQGQLSPDGRWLAYASDESGTWEVYVQSFPALGAKRAISTGGGSEPQWRPDGRELYYIAADGTLMAVGVQGGDVLQISRPTPLFRTPLAVSGELHTRRNHYAATRDGQRFLIDAPRETDESMTVLVNWQQRLAP